jgi:hypothetical protein
MLDDWLGFDDDEVWFGHGHAEALGGQDARPPRRSVSPAAQRCFDLDRARRAIPPSRPIGFHRPPVR